MKKPQISLLDEVEERKTPIEMVLGDRDHEPEVRLDELLASIPGLALDVCALRMEPRHPTSKVPFLLGGQKRSIIDILQVFTDFGIPWNEGGGRHAGSPLSMPSLTLSGRRVLGPARP
jgi:hypothetical protein